MTQEDKDLLLKDICGRLPYEVKVCCNKTVYNIDFCTKSAFILAEPLKPSVCIIAHIEEIKPYLFPLSSMTEEQKKEFDLTLKYLPKEEMIFWTLNTYDWCIKNHFDFRGLIPKGLAIDATGKNIY